ncbi:MAG: AI-2E family transporter [Clostridia bacterium]|nr:AI-2E family transporter [Clostridia bacterium]
MKQKKVISKWVYYFSLGVGLILVYRFVSDFGIFLEGLKKVISVIMPFIMAIILAYLFYKPVAFLERIFNKNKILSKIARPLSVFSTYIIAIMLITLLINCVIPPIKQSTQELINNLPNYIETAKKAVSNTNNNSILKEIDLEELTKKIQEFDFESLISTDKIIEYAGKVIGVFGLIFNIFVTIIVSIYLLLQRKDIKEFLKKFAKAVFDDYTYSKINKYFDKSNHILLDFIYCQILDGIIIGILAAIAMSIIGVKYSVLLGFFIGLFNIIPYFGAIMAIGISIFITLFTGGINQAIIMAITVIILQQIDSNIINPKILGEGLKISPILVIFAVTIGGEFFGIIGMFLAVPIAAIIKVIIMDFIEIRIKIKSYRKNKIKIET